MKISNQLYDTLKFLCTTGLPAILTFFGLIGKTLGLECTEVVLTIGAGAIACLGTILGISSNTYKIEGQDE